MGLRTIFGLKKLKDRSRAKLARPLLKPAAAQGPSDALQPATIKSILQLSEAARWYEDKELTSDWFSRSAIHWLEPLQPLRGREIDYLEVGTWEGRSSVFVAEFIPASRLTCIDIFRDPEVERRFDFNMAPYGDRVFKLKDRSGRALDRLIEGKQSFDLIYVDAQHIRWSVFSDTVLAWRLLRIGGMIIWDDYQQNLDRPSEARPQHAIDLFRATFRDCITDLHIGYQIIARKTADWPAAFN